MVGPARLEPATTCLEDRWPLSAHGQQVLEKAGVLPQLSTALGPTVVNYVVHKFHKVQQLPITCFLLYLATNGHAYTRIGRRFGSSRVYACSLVAQIIALF